VTKQSRDIPKWCDAFAFIAAALAAVSAIPASAQSYPVKPITIVVPFPAGGATDFLARLLGQKVSESLKQPVIVVNRAGATGAIGLESVARARSDGYTLILATASSLGTNPAVSKVPFDPVKDFTPIGLIAAEPLGLAVHPSVPAKNVRQLIALAKAQPGQLTMASFGTGSVSHLAGELFSSMAGIKMLHVPYKGAAPATADLIAGHVALMFNSISVFVEPAQAGRLRMLATCAAQRTRLLPNLPTIAESGVAGFEAGTWHAILGPANLPPEIVKLLSSELGKALKYPDVQEKLLAISLEPQSATPEQLATTLQRDVAKWKKIVAQTGIKIQ
jgi:tripartite-type tricarboxylate transporter receptor subunit TctC